MIKKYIFIVCFLGGVMVTGCSDLHNSTSISGEIANPTDSFLTISKNEETIDTIPLDANNRFVYQFDDDVQPGLYKFRNGLESQMFYIEKGDSVQFRLNTRKFDKSLMYSGNTAPVNNFLMKIFLENRKNNKIFPHYYKYSPTEFSALIDSIRVRHLQDLNDLSLRYEIPEEFIRIAKGIIDYASYDYHERYYFLITKYNRKLLKELPAGFLSYRKTADFNAKSLQNYYVYQYFIEDYIKNRTIADCLEDSSNDDCFNLHKKANLERSLTLSNSYSNFRAYGRGSWGVLPNG